MIHENELRGDIVFSETLRKLRKNKKLNQAQLAKELYISPSAVSQYETGRTTIKHKNHLESFLSQRFQQGYFTVEKDRETTVVRTIFVLTKVFHVGNILRVSHIYDTKNIIHPYTK